MNEHSKTTNNNSDIKNTRDLIFTSVSTYKNPPNKQILCEFKETIFNILAENAMHDLNKKYTT